MKVSFNGEGRFKTSVAVLAKPSLARGALEQVCLMPASLQISDLEVTLYYNLGSSLS